jgi:hypothetical protein
MPWPIAVAILALALSAAPAAASTARDTPDGGSPTFDWQRAVRFGGPTTDEMDLGWLSFAYVDRD